MPIPLQRQLVPPGALEQAQYTTETASGRPAICCPLCGDVDELPETHRVLERGAVSPIYSCLRCPFLDFIVLRNFGEEVLR